MFVYLRRTARKMGQPSSKQLSPYVDIAVMRRLGRDKKVDIEEDPVEVAKWIDKDAVKGIFLTRVMVR